MKTQNQIIARPEWVKRELKLARASIDEALNFVEEGKTTNAYIELWIDNAKNRLNSALDGIKQ